MKIDDIAPPGAPARRRGRVGSAGPVATADGHDIPPAELTPRVAAALQRLVGEVDRLKAELGRARTRTAELERLADQDDLVPLANRRAFLRELARHVAYAERYGQPSSVLFVDLNGMKAINDRLGHAAGDAAIRHVADLLARNVRESDLVGRLGGDEFGVVLAHADAKAAEAKARVLAARIAATPLIWDGRAVQLAAACGTFTFTGKEDAGEALQRADEEMYRQKPAGSRGAN